MRRNQNFSPRFRKSDVKNIELNTKAISYQNIKLNTDDTIFRYPNLTKIPETDFTCNGKKGMFADVETNCQVRIYIYILNTCYIFFCYSSFQTFYFLFYFTLHFCIKI